MHSFITETIFIYHFHSLFRRISYGSTIDQDRHNSESKIYSQLKFESKKKKNQRPKLPEWNNIFWNRECNFDELWDLEWSLILSNFHAAIIVVKTNRLMNVANDNWIWCDIQFSNYNFAVRNKADGIDAFFMLYSFVVSLSLCTRTSHTRFRQSKGSECKANFQIDWFAASNQLN